MLVGGESHRGGEAHGTARDRRARGHCLARALRRRRLAGDRQAARHGGASRARRVARHGGERAAAPRRSSPASSPRNVPASSTGSTRTLPELLLIARHERAQLALSCAFRERRVRKTYLAIVLGVPRGVSGSLEWAIGRHPHERQRMSIRSRSPRDARTRYSVVERFDALALLRLEPETGRTHQIRVHLAAMGHPVLADPLYGAKRRRALPTRDRRAPSRVRRCTRRRSSWPIPSAVRPFISSRRLPTT